MMPTSSAHKFKPNQNKVTEFRIKLVMKYMAHCYALMVNDKKTYDFNKRGTVKQEDFLRNGLVEDYLSKKENKDYYKNNISDNPNVDISFAKEENQIYEGEKGLADDYIDISVKENKLTELLSSKTSDEIRFAVECKRINKTVDYSKYVGDIQKFADRAYTTYRMPFEGQIAFIEDSKLSHVVVSSEVNTRLKKSKTITTSKFLSSVKLYDGLDSVYESVHNRNHTGKNPFSIVHLMLDYSAIALNG